MVLVYIIIALVLYRVLIRYNVITSGWWRKPKVIKIAGTIVIIIVGYHVWDYNTDPVAHFDWYGVSKVSQKVFLKGNHFTQSSWGPDCHIAYEYNAQQEPDERPKTRRFQDWLYTVWPCEEGMWRAIIVRKNGNVYEVLWWLKKGADTDPEMIRNGKNIANVLSATVFYAPVDIHMCDEFFKTNRVISSQKFHK